MEILRFEGNRLLGTIITVVAIIAFLAQAIILWQHPLADTQQTGFLLFFGALTILILLFRNRSYTVCFLLSTFTMITAWRLSGLAQLNLVVYIYLIGILLKFLNYLICAHHYITLPKRQGHTVQHQLCAYEWQLVFIRLFIGFDLIPHFCEKLFAGSAIRMADIHDFAALGVGDPTTMVIIAGCMELGGAFAISCGFITRLGSICLVSYLLVATYLGHHFTNGFIWADPGGGWEYPVLWSAIILSFSVFGAGDFSLDRILKDTYKVPLWVKHFMGGRTS